MQIEIHPLVPEAVLPEAATARTRAHVPPGYGVQEQCLPFTAAAAAGVLIRAPFSFGYCATAAVPAGARPFAPPHRAAGADLSHVFYVEDHAAGAFVGNAFRLTPIAYHGPDGQADTYDAVHPGLSFFARPDQADMFKVHLPFVLRTPLGIDSLFTIPVNRAAPLDLVAGLVETDWYAHPVSLIARLPAIDAIHVKRGDIIAHAMFVHRTARSAEIEVVPFGTAASVPVQRDLLRWYASHAADKSAYKRLAHSRDDRVDPTDVS